MASEGGYLTDTRHPWPCLLFLLPLLIAYELGVLWLGGPQPEALRNGVDSWLRWALVGFGVRQMLVLPGFIALVFVAWSWLRRDDRPKDIFGTLLGMTLESVIFALGLYGLCACLNPLLFPAPVMSVPEGVPEGVQQVVTFVGAGIYEEVVFRLGLFTFAYGFLRLTLTPSLLASLMAAAASAAAFAAVHHVGPYGETFEAGAFAFRLVAGIYFALLFRLRGFGVVVGAHAIYDLLAGFSMSS